MLTATGEQLTVFSFWPIAKITKMISNVFFRAPFMEISLPDIYVMMLMSICHLRFGLWDTWTSDQTKVW